ncbi:MAG: amidohydrolase family protein [Pseudomonadales bacterium]|nr:amidohydrolase family protein [Pseudomonadales bacterium]NIX08644.1 amidohydrolase family protein [Pseudomonadales bacterium]
MAYDILIRNGTVVDGSGGAPYPADVGIRDGRIAAIGRIREKARTNVDAEGLVVSPGFVDGHTHMDAQVFWDPIGSSSCYHGVTSVVMGNCGFTLAPCRKDEADLVFRNLERAEDLSREAMLAGIDWQWETFPQFLDAVDGLPKGINYAGYIGHSALRTYVMGERAFSEAATEEDLAGMCRHVQDAVRAGAIGFSTSRTFNHITADDRPVASRLAEWNEVRAIVNAMGETGKGIFEIAGEAPGRDPDRIRDYHERLRDLAVESGVTQTWGMFSVRIAPDFWRPYFDLLDETAAAGGRMYAQVHSRALNVLLSFKTSTPFDTWDVWKDVRSLPLEEQMAKLRDPALRARLVEAANREYQGPRVVGAEARPPNWEWVYPMADMSYDQPSMAALAAERGVDPVELMIDMSLARDFDIFFRQPIANENQDDVLEMMKHPRAVVTFSDSGAHVSQIMDSSLQTHLLSYWVREKQAFTLQEAVRRITYDTATMWGLHDRGLVREGMAADLVIFDPDTIGPRMPTVEHDLPAGARRLKQTADGILHTIVNGEVLLTRNEHSGATPGRLLRA